MSRLKRLSDFKGQSLAERSINESSNFGSLDGMAAELVGDGKDPNLYFVTRGGKTLMVTIDKDAAYSFWKSITTSSNETQLEDRKNGSLAGQVKDDEKGGKLSRWDEVH